MEALGIVGQTKALHWHFPLHSSHFAGAHCGAPSRLPFIPARSSDSSSRRHRPTVTMPQTRPSDKVLAALASQQRVVIPNIHGEKLVGVLHETGSREVVVLCHGFRSSKDEKIILNLTATIFSQGLSVFRFDFAGNGESGGAFEYGNYWKEVEDLRSVIMHLSEQNYQISAIAGHSKGGDVVLLYASKYHNVHTVINISGRFSLDRGIAELLGKDFMQRIKKDGFIVLNDKRANADYRVSEESLMDRINTDVRAACFSIDSKCRVFTVHGSADEIIPVEDALEFAKIIPTHKLHIIEGANHCYTSHQPELCQTISDILKSNQEEEKGSKEEI